MAALTVPTAHASMDRVVTAAPDRHHDHGPEPPGAAGTCCPPRGLPRSARTGRLRPAFPPFSADRPLPWDPATFSLSVRGQEVYSTIRSQDGAACACFSAPSLGQAVHRRGPGGGLPGRADREMAHLTRALLTLIPLVLLIAGWRRRVPDGRDAPPRPGHHAGGEPDRGGKPLRAAGGRGPRRVFRAGRDLQ